MITYNTASEVAEKICNYLEKMGFTTDRVVSGNTLKKDIANIISSNMDPLPEVNERISGNCHRTVYPNGEMYECPDEKQLEMFPANS